MFRSPNYVNRMADAGGSSGSGSGMPFSGNIQGGYSSQKGKTTYGKSEWVQAPDYAEAEGARKSWWELLQEFSGQPGYGAIAPDWGQIWQDAQKQVQQYFWGSPTDPGVVGKVKASAARRNVSESPAMENSLARMAATEGNLLSTMATEQAAKKAEFSEAGRLNYLQSLMQLANLKPQGTFYTPWTENKQSGWSLKGMLGFG